MAASTRPRRRPRPWPGLLSVLTVGVHSVDACGSLAVAVDALATACGSVCGSADVSTLTLCVVRSPENCSVDCVHTAAAATAWTLQWIETEASAVNITYHSNDSTSTATIVDGIDRIDDAVELPASLERLTMIGPSTARLRTLPMGATTLNSFASLRQLRLDHLNLSGWTTLPSMPQLRMLSLNNDDLTVWPATSLFDDLQSLSLDENPRLASAVDALTLPVSLQSLSLRSSTLKTLPSSIARLPSLQELHISQNPGLSLPSTLPATLRTLNLSHNQLTTLPAALLNLSALQTLDVRGNPLNATALDPAQTVFLRFVRTVLTDVDLLGTHSSGTADELIVAEVARQSINRNLWILAATLVVALVLVSLITVALRRSKRTSDKSGFDCVDGGDFWSTLELAGDREMTADEWRALQMWTFWEDPDVLRLRVPWDLICDRQVIGSGAYSVLWLARVDGFGLSVAARPVFLKALQPAAQRARHGPGAAAAVQALIREVQLLRTLRHPHIVALLGVTWMNAPTDVQVVMEDVANGDLRAYREMTQAPPPPPGRWRASPTVAEEDGGLSLRVALQVADTLVYLHDQGVVHNDVRSRNVLLDESSSVKLTGFGRHVFVEAKSESEEDERTSGADGRVHTPPPGVDDAFLLDAGRWMAPEVLRGHLSRLRKAKASTTAGGTASAASDVYSFGVLLLELDTFEMPFARVDVDEEDELDAEDADEGIRVVVEGDLMPSYHLVSDSVRFSSLPPGHNSLLGGVPADAPAPSAPSPPSSSTQRPQSEDDAYEMALLRRLAHGRIRPELASSCPMGIGDLILQCVDADPRRRPTMRQVQDALKEFAAAASARTNSRRSTRSSARPPSSSSSFRSQRSVSSTAPTHSSVASTTDPTFTATTVATEATVDDEPTATCFVEQQSPTARGGSTM